MTTRRDCVSFGLAASLVAAVRPLAAQAPMPRVVFVNPGTEEQQRENLDAFRAGLRQAGQVEGKTLDLVIRHADRDPSRLPDLIREAVAAHASVIVVAGLLTAKLARDATSTVPVVMATGSDLVDAGLAKSYSRPGGNVTGVADLSDETAVKRLELLGAALPGTKRVAMIVNPEFPATPKIRSRVDAAAGRMGVTIAWLTARNRNELMRVLDGLDGARTGALFVTDAVGVQNRVEIIERATALRIPVVHLWPGTAELGALISYQADIPDNYRRAAGYVDRILKGAKPGDLPIFQPTKYELVVNANTARTLGLALPQSFLLRADRVIQ